MTRDYMAEQGLLHDTPTPGRKRDDHAEFRLQMKCITATRRHMRTNPGLRFIANMPEGFRDKKRAAVAKMMGLEPGCADIIILRREGWTLTLDWCELKRTDGRGKLSPAQAAWAAWLMPCVNVRCHVVDSLPAFLAILRG